MTLGKCFLKFFISGLFALLKLLSIPKVLIIWVIPVNIYHIKIKQKLKYHAY